MFERYTEKARRVIFFARLGASQSGSPYIETEHLLLGLLREEPLLLSQLLGPTHTVEGLRREIETRIPRREYISASVEIPLTDDSKRVLILAAEESDRLGHRDIEPEHILAGILIVEKSVAARLLRERDLKPGPIREQLAKTRSPVQTSSPPTGALLALNSFLAGLKGRDSEDLISFFAQNAEFIDASGKRWNREEIRKGFGTLFAPYAKKNASFLVETTLAQTSDLCIAGVLWENAVLASEQRAWMHRMSVTLVFQSDDWQILLVQATPVQPS